MPAVNLSPLFNASQEFTAGGLVLAGGLLTTYNAGTSTPLATYTTSIGNIANSNPIQLGPDGRPPGEIWLAVGLAYKFILTDSLGLNPLSFDNIFGINDILNLNVNGNTVLGGVGSTLNASGGALTIAGGNTAIGGNLTVANNTTFGDAGTDLTVFNASSVTWNNTPTMTGAMTFASAITFTSAITFSANPAGRILGETWTTTATGVTNITGTPTVLKSTYQRIGKTVSAVLTLTATITAATTQTVVECTLPIASNFAVFNDCIGGGAIGTFSVANSGTTPFVQANAANDKASIVWNSGVGTGAVFITVWFQYEII